MQQISFAYNFEQKRILDPLSLSVATKQIHSLSEESQTKLMQNVPQIKKKLETIKDIRE